MSIHHHDENYYWWQKEHYPMCFFCQVRRGQQFHHLQLVGADNYAGPMPRRHSTYNSVYVCDQCHDDGHDRVGERKLIEQHFGSREVVMMTVLNRLHHYLGWVRQRAVAESRSTA